MIFIKDETSLKMRKVSDQKGQIALVLVLAITAAGALIVSLADRSTRSLRTRGIEAETVKALKGAESGVEQALLNQETVSSSLGSGGVSYDASYSDEGGEGLLSVDLVQPGDVLEVLLDGASAGVNELRIYFSSEGSAAALKISEYRANLATDEYLVNYMAVDGDSARGLGNGFTDAVEGAGYGYKGVDFGHRSAVSVNADTLVQPVTKMVRIMVLFVPTRIGVEPVGGDLPDQQVVVSSVGTYSTSADAKVKRKIELKKEKERVPAVFDKVIYSNVGLIQ